MAQLQIGRIRARVKNNDELVQKLTDAIYDQRVTATVFDAQREGPVIAARMQAAAVAEMEKIGPFIALNLIGIDPGTKNFPLLKPKRRERKNGKNTLSDRFVEIRETVFQAGMDTGSRFNPGEENQKNPLRSTNNLFSYRKGGRTLKWRELAASTQNRKGHARFFEDTKALRAEIAGTDFNAVTGGVSVRFVPAKTAATRNVSRKTIYGQIRTKLAPRLAIPGLATGDWTTTRGSFIEQALFPEFHEQLTNPKGQQRHLLQPTLNFWLMFRVPRALSRAFSKAFYYRSRGYRG